MDMSHARAQHLDAVEEVLRNVRRSLPLGAGASPMVICSGVDHLDPELRSGSVAYVALVETMRARGLL